MATVIYDDPYRLFTLPITGSLQAIDLTLSGERILHEFLPGKAAIDHETSTFRHLPRPE